MMITIITITIANTNDKNKSTANIDNKNDITNNDTNENNMDGKN